MRTQSWYYYQGESSGFRKSVFVFIPVSYFYLLKLSFLYRICDLTNVKLLNKVLAPEFKSGRAFRIGFGPKVDKNFGLNSGRDILFVLGAQKYNRSS